MRNLKRVFSLGMTAAMISSLMVVSSSAATYKDVTSEENQEAIEVLNAVGIMIGDDNGNFNPDSKVTRNEMAVVMSNLMAYNAATYKNTSPFTDVPSWAEPYVAACYTNGITKGYTATTYGGSDNVTTAQAALMLMRALGYFEYQSDFGDDWQLATVSQGNKIDLFDDVDSGVKEAMTRNDLAQLVLNTLESGTVEAENDTVKVVTDGATVETGKVTYKYITSGKDYAKAINDKLATYTDGTYSSGYIVELGEKLFDGDLTKEEGTDDFGRPANIWDYQAKEVGTYADDADATFSAKVTSKALYNAVGKTAMDNYKWTVTVNGTEVDYDGKDLSANKSDDDDDFYAEAGKDGSSVTGLDDEALTGNGVVTQVFVDGTDETVDVAIMYYYAAEVYEVDEDDGTITLSDLQNGPADTNDEYDSTAFAEDDIVMYSYANGDIKDVYAATEMSGEVTRVRANTSDMNGDNFVVDGTTYKYNMTTVKDRLITDSVNNDVVAYTDAYGYVGYIDESAVTYDYAYVLSMGTDGDKYGYTSSSQTVYARLVLTDGTMIKVETDEDDTSLEHHIVSYSKDSSDVYSLTKKDGNVTDKTTGTNGTLSAKDDDALKIENGVASFTAPNRTYTANKNTVFIVADPDTKYDDYDFTIYTGKANVPDIEGQTGTVVDVAADEDGVAKVVYIQDADVSGSGNVYYAVAKTNAKLVKDSDGNKYYEIEAVVDGEVTTLNVKEGSDAATILVDYKSTSNNKIVEGENSIATSSSNKHVVALKSINTNSDGLVTSVKLYTALDDGDGSAVAEKTGKVENETVKLGSTRYGWDDDVVVVRYNTAGNLEVSRISSVKDDYNDSELYVLDGNVLTGLCIVETKGSGTKTNDSDEVDNGDVSASAKMNNNGKVNVTFSIERPEYVPASATVEVTGDLYIDGAYAETVGTTIVANKTSAIKTSGNSYDTDSSVSLKNVEIAEYSAVKVQYKDASGNDVTMDSSAPTSVATGSSVSFEAKISDKAYTSDSVSKASATLNGTALTNTSGKLSGTSLTVADDGYAKVVISGLTEAEATYTVTVPSDAVSGAKISVDATSYKKGQNAVVSATVASPADDAYATVVTIKGVGSVTIPASDKNATQVGTIEMTQDVTISASDVTVTTVKKLAVESVAWTSGKITITFNEDVETTADKDTDFTLTDATTDGTAKINSVAVSGKVVTLTISGDTLAAGDTIKVASSLTGTDSQNAATEVTYTLAAGGTATKNA